MDLDEGFLCDLVGIVGVTRESQRPSKHGWLERPDKLSKRFRVSSLSETNDAVEPANSVNAIHCRSFDIGKEEWGAMSDTRLNLRANQGRVADPIHLARDYAAAEQLFARADDNRAKSCSAAA